jgi:hypothetical protein
MKGRRRLQTNLPFMSDDALGRQLSDDDELPCERNHQAASFRCFVFFYNHSTVLILVGTLLSQVT